jgi:hypothetical protein
MKNLNLSPASGAIVIAILASLLYIPFLGNPIIFDDHNVFTLLGIYDNVSTAFDFVPRTFPYYTLSLVQVLFGSIKAHRIVSLALHILCGWMLFLLLEALVRDALKTEEPAAGDHRRAATHARVLACIGAVWFVIHPVAVYGAGYLMQRTGLFATLFSLMSLWFFRCAFTENRTIDIVAAALCYSVAVFSKEHAIMLPAAAVLLTALYGGDLRSNARRIGLYLALCIPAAVTVLLTRTYLVGAGYEPVFGTLFSRIHGIPLLDLPKGPWLVSALMQAGFFFDYLGYWIVPDIRSMSVDMRVDFTGLWTAWWFFPKAALFLASPVAALYLLRRRGLAALFACGFLYCWLMFLTELASVRFQEPFVLYRSYLWAPGYIIMTVAVCRALSLSRRWVVAASVPLLIVCFGLARERLEVFTTESAVWKEAGAKLASESLIGADRIFYNRGLQYLKENQFNAAISDFSRVIAENPTAYKAYYHRGVAYYSLNDIDKAQGDFDLAFTMNSKDGAIQFARGLLLERRGCMAQAKRAYTISLGLGFATARLRLNLLAKNVVLEGETKPRPEPISCKS